MYAGGIARSHFTRKTNLATRLETKAKNGPSVWDKVNCKLTVDNIMGQVAVRLHSGR